MGTIAVNFEDTVLALQPGQSLLEAAMQHNLAIPNSCRSGVCQTCLIKIPDDPIPPQAQQGLNANQKEQKLALACQLQPTQPLRVYRAAHINRHFALVTGHTRLTGNILRLRLHADVDWYPGQFITIWKNPALGRPYSIASLKNEGFLELHVRHYPQGSVSAWLHGQVSVGDTLRIGGPGGGCFYVPSMAGQPLLLVGLGTGLAPLYGVAREALAQGHAQPIVLYAAARNEREAYLSEELANLEKTHANFSYRQVLREHDRCPWQGDVLRAIQTEHSQLRHWCVFLCGAPGVVGKLQKLCFLNGASMADIHADPFVVSQE